MKTILPIIFVLISFGSNASVTTKYVDIYRKSGYAPKIVRIPMSFDSDSLLRMMPRLNIGKIYQIDYVASAPKKSGIHYQNKLNAARWERFRKTISIPEDSEHSEYTFYQTRFNTEKEAAQLFHGFVVYYELPVSVVHAQSQSQFDDLISEIAGQKIYTNTRSINVKKSVVKDSVYVGTLSETRKKRMDKLLTQNNYILDWSYDSIGIDKNFHGAYYKLTQVAAGIFAAYQALVSTSLFSQLNRINITNKTLIVTDMTGSMYPYFSQLLVWHALKMNEGDKLPYVFFNDGDNRQTKRIGSAGGLYPTETNQTLNLYRTMNKCMKGGNGGDTPENNFEAVLEGLSRYEGIEKIVLICDNWAFPRDASLMHNIDIPIEFVMCGGEFGLNPKYLDLAHQHVSSTLITVEKSINEMQNMSDNSSFESGKFKYTLHRGFFKRNLINEN